MNTIAHDAGKLSELDAGIARAWRAYSERLHELTGDEYDRLEHESWAELQRELGRLEHRRQTLHQGAD